MAEFWPPPLQRVQPEGFVPMRLPFVSCGRCRGLQLKNVRQRRELVLCRPEPLIQDHCWDGTLQPWRPHHGAGGVESEVEGAMGRLSACQIVTTDRSFFACIFAPRARRQPELFGKRRGRQRVYQHLVDLHVTGALESPGHTRRESVECRSGCRSCGCSRPSPRKSVVPVGLVAEGCHKG